VPCLRTAPPSATTRADAARRTAARRHGQDTGHASRRRRRGLAVVSGTRQQPRGPPSLGIRPRPWPLPQIRADPRLAGADGLGARGLCVPGAATSVCVSAQQAQPAGSRTGRVRRRSLASERLPTARRMADPRAQADPSAMTAQEITDAVGRRIARDLAEQAAMSGPDAARERPDAGPTTTSTRGYGAAADRRRSRRLAEPARRASTPGRPSRTAGEDGASSRPDTVGPRWHARAHERSSVGRPPGGGVGDRRDGVPGPRRRPRRGHQHGAERLPAPRLTRGTGGARPATPASGAARR